MFVSSSSLSIVIILIHLCDYSFANAYRTREKCFFFGLKKGTRFHKKKKRFLISFLLPRAFVYPYFQLRARLCPAFLFRARALHTLHTRACLPAPLIPYSFIPPSSRLRSHSFARGREVALRQLSSLIGTDKEMPYKRPTLALTLTLCCVHIKFWKKLKYWRLFEEK